ncbi:hypothetical protein BDF14DRAFT_1885705 [Spinellus fusiger]|nr:hypothetical protein BDF14DRAFT_1885705 [Spinellus fusiger]
MEHSIKQKEETKEISSGTEDNEQKFIEVLRGVLAIAESYTVSNQEELLSLVVKILSGKHNPGAIEKERLDELLTDLIKRFGWEMVDYVVPFLTSTHGDIEACKGVRRVSSQLLEKISETCSYRELYILTSERLSLVDWEMCLNEEEVCVKTAIESIEIFKRLGKALERCKNTKVFDSFIVYPVRYCIKTLHFLKRVLCVHSSWRSPTEKPNRWDDIAYSVTSSILDLIEYGSVYTAKSDGTMDLSKAYNDHYHAKYKIQEPELYSNNASFSERKKSPVFELAMRSIKLISLLGVTADDLLNIRRNPLLIFDELSPTDDDNDRDTIHPTNFPLSYNGIASVFIMSTYDQCLKRQDLNQTCQSDSSVPILYKQLCRKYLGLLLNLLMNIENDLHVDKTLFALLYLSDNIDMNVTLATLDKEILGPVGIEKTLEMTRVFQIISSAASLSENSEFRFLAYRLLGRFLDICNDEARMFLMMELHKNCPYPTMKVAAIGLLKEQVNRCFNRTNNMHPSIFTSRVLVDEFFSVIFQGNSEWCNSEDVFWEDYSYQIQALNFYLYLLIRDRYENKTTVWDKENQYWMDKNYMSIIELTVDKWTMHYKEELANENEEKFARDNPMSPEFKMVKLDVIKNTINQIMQQRALYATCENSR